MNEIVIKNIEKINHITYIAHCIVVTGKININEIWSLKFNPKIKITVEKIIKIDHKESYLIDIEITKPLFDLFLLQKPTFWIK